VGLGGGALVVPINILFFDLNITKAVALTKVSIFAGAISRFASEITARNPKQNKPLID